MAQVIVFIRLFVIIQGAFGLVFCSKSASFTSVNATREVMMKTKKSKAVAAAKVEPVVVDPAKVSQEIFEQAFASLQKGAIESTKLAILKAMQSSNATQASVSYSGSGDSGDDPQFETDDPALASASINVLKINRKFIDGEWGLDVTSELITVEDAAISMCEMLIERHHAGYEDNEGGCGSLVFHKETMSVELECTDYYTESNTTTRTI